MWNHRILAHEGCEGEIWLQVHEVYYNDLNNPIGYSQNAAKVGDETIKGLEWTLKQMKKCLKRPILWAGDRFPYEYVPLPVVTCICGEVIPNSNMEYSNRCNEEGEEYGEVSIKCSFCKTEYETSQWGEFENKEEAMEYLIEYIKDRI